MGLSTRPQQVKWYLNYISNSQGKESVQHTASLHASQCSKSSLVISSSHPSSAHTQLSIISITAWVAFRFRRGCPPTRSLVEGRHSKVKNIQEDEYDKCCLARKRPSDLQATKPLNEWFVYFNVTWRLLLSADMMLTIAVLKPSNIPTWFQLGSNRLKTSGNGIFPSHNTCVHGNDRMELKFKKKNW